jgi:hypothetical protein
MTQSAASARPRRATILATLLAATTTATHAADFAVFGNRGVNIAQSATIDGLVGSNFDVNVTAFSTFGGVVGGGTLFGSSFTSKGDVVFNGDVYAASSTVLGTLYAGNTVNLAFSSGNTGTIVAGGNVLQGQSATTTGNIFAGGSFTNQNFSQVNGNVYANGSAYINGAVNGDVKYQGTVSVGPFGAVTGSKLVGPTPISPLAFAPVTLPAATQFSSGGPAVTTGGTAATPLAPGSYGALSIPTFGDLYLTAGDYFFDSFFFDGDDIHLVNLSPNNRIRIFVTGNVYHDTFTDVTVNGQPFASADASLVGNVLLETHGHYSQTPPGLGSVTFFGTIFAPYGNITIGIYSSVKGSLLAGGQIDIGVGFNMPLIPEPASLSLLAMGSLALLCRRRSSHN